MSALVSDFAEVIEIRSMRDVKESFPLGVANHLNWLFCSTSGRHGTYASLDDIERILRQNDETTKPLHNGRFYITVMIVHPRLATLKYGEIQVNLSDVALLRRLVKSTIEAIAESQIGNV